MSSASFTVLSWNVYRNYRARRLAASLEQLMERYAPDVLLFQEAPVYASSRFADLPLFAGLHARYAPVHLIHRPGGRLNFLHSGQLTLSKLPLETTEVYELPPLPSRTRPGASRKGTIRRNVLYTRLRLGSTAVGLYNVHFENRAGPAGRARQARHLLEIIRSGPEEVVVVGGDFNSRFTRTLETSLRLFAAEGFLDPFRHVGPAWRPRLDYILLRGAEVLEADELRVRGSDHRPVLLRFRLSTAGCAPPRRAAKGTDP